MLLIGRYIATRSMILIMYTQESATIRSVFSKASDLPIALERLNATTYVYATINKNARKAQPFWMFNFLYFTGRSCNTFYLVYSALIESFRAGKEPSSHASSR
jgi:hypothetical protein